jgi:AcrR family transcriptional regulator
VARLLLAGTSAPSAAHLDGENCKYQRRTHFFVLIVAGTLLLVTRLPKSLSKSPVDDVQLSREEIGEQQRRRILLALTEVFAKRGYQAATVDNLIAAAKISMGSFYGHFEGKEDCLLQIYDLVVSEVRERIDAAAAGTEDWAERTYAGLYAIVNYVVERPMAARVVLLEAQTAGPRAVRRYNEDLKRVADFLREGRSTGVYGAELPSDFEEATANGLAWLLQARLVRGEVTDPDALFHEIGEVALEPYLGAAKTRQSLVAFTLAAT